MMMSSKYMNLANILILIVFVSIVRKFLKNRLKKYSMKENAKNEIIRLNKKDKNNMK